MSSNLQLPTIDSNKTSLVTLETPETLTKKTSGVLKNPRGKQRKPKKEHQKSQRGITFGALEETQNEEQDSEIEVNKPRFSVVQFGSRRSSKVSDERRASRGSIVRAKGILDNMNVDPDQLEINVNKRSLIATHGSKDMIDHSKDFRMSAHDDFVNARNRVAKRGVLGGTVSLRKKIY